MARIFSCRGKNIRDMARYVPSVDTRERVGSAKQHSDSTRVGVNHPLFRYLYLGHRSDLESRAGASLQRGGGFVRGDGRGELHGTEGVECEADEVYGSWGGK